MADYVFAKMIALGLKESIPSLPVNEWTVEKPSGIFKLDNIFSDFEHSLESNLPEQEKQMELKQHLVKWFQDDYPADQSSAEERAIKLILLIESNDDSELQQMLSSFPAAEWLSIIFLQENRLSELVQSIRKSSRATKTVLLSAITKEESRLVRFKQIMQNIKEVCSQ